MNEKKGYKPLRKTLAYMKRMINSGKWKANCRIPTIASIAESSNTSVNTVRKAIRTMENERLLDNNGSLGFCVVPSSMTALFYTDKHLYYLRLLKINLRTTELLDNGGTPIGKYIITKKDKALGIYNVISGVDICTSVEELQDAMHHPTTLASLIPLTGAKLTQGRQKYLRQELLRDVGKVVLKSKELLP
jgi:DNA-binding transcriptional regulator YhcF (GntR family)